jgi:uncharacterized protein (DUF779 family)
MEVVRVAATEAALQLIEKLRAKYGPLMFHQSGGCVTATRRCAIPKKEFKVSGADVSLGEIGAVPFYMSASQFAYWKHTQLIIDGGFNFEVQRCYGRRHLKRRL